MADPSTPAPQEALSREVATEMARYGITKKSIDVFYHEDCRYTSLRDAVAQAKRVVAGK